MSPRVLLAEPRGFCAGVEMAIKALTWLVRAFDEPVYCYHEIVHNRLVVERFEAQGVVFVDDIDDVPDGAPLMLSAHGSAPEVVRRARQVGGYTVDAVCPLVTKVHREAIRHARAGYTIVLIGHDGHDEVLGTMGEAPEAIVLIERPEDVEQLEIPDETKVAYLTQTTLSVDDAKRIIQQLRLRFPQISAPAKGDICYATQNRQEAVIRLSQEADLVLVLGSRNSSNSQRLAELSRERGVPAWLLDGPQDIEHRWFENVATVLVTAGASAPEVVVKAVLDYLREQFGATVELRSLREESVSFPLPQELRRPN